MIRVVADLGNTRLKWGRLDESGRLAETIALPLDDPTAWAAAWAAGIGSSRETLVVGRLLGQSAGRPSGSRSSSATRASVG